MAGTRPEATESLRVGDVLDRNTVRQALGALSTLIPVGLFLADPDGRCWYVNQRLVDALGLQLSSRDDRPFRLEVPGRGAAAGATPYLEVTAPVAVPQSGDGAAGGPGDEQPRLDGLRLDTRVIPLVSQDGRTVAYAGVVVDGAESASGPLALHTSERLVDALIDRSPEVITILNEDGSWRYSNAAAWRLFGFQTDFDPAEGLLPLIHPEDLEQATGSLARLRSSDHLGADAMEVRVRSADGSWRYLECVVENLLEDPVVHGFLLRSRDVTERRQVRMDLLEANERLSTLISSLHLAVLMEDDDRRILFTNEAFVGLFELPTAPEGLVGRTIAELGPEFFRRFGDPTWSPGDARTEEIIRERRPVVGDRLVMMDNRVLERDYLPIVAVGEYRGHVWLFRDVSAQARAESAWELLIARQRRENERLLELDRVKAAFLAEISHELRTPLTSILSFSELLADGIGKDDPVEQTEFLDIIKRNAERLLRLVDDLLLLDRLETGAMSLEWGVVDLPSLLVASVSSFAPAAEDKSIVLSCEIGEGPTIPGDGDRLAQVLDVLLSNATKFTPEGGRIVASATPHHRLWRIEVTDSGIGVPEEEQEALFERFFRASNARASRIPGSGLGLAVARAIVELHGGSIVLRSTEGEGTTLSVTLPIPQSPERSENPGRSGADGDG